MDVTSLPDDDRFTRACPECHASLLEDVLRDRAWCPNGHSFLTRGGARVWEVYDMADRERAGLVVDAHEQHYVRWTPKYHEALEPILRSQGEFAKAKRRDRPRVGVAA